MFETYVELGTVDKLQAVVRQRGIVSKVWISTTGNKRGGTSYNRGPIYYLLSSPLYVGLVRHKGEVHPGMHSPIISRDLWERVQTCLANNRSNQGKRSAIPCDRPLVGILFDDRGNAMSPSFTKKADG